MSNGTSNVGIAHMDVDQKCVVTVKTDEIVQVDKNSGHHTVMDQLTAILSFHMYYNYILHAVYNT